MAGIQPYQANASMPWNKKRVIHLFRRLGFGPTPLQIDQALMSDPLIYIEGLIDGVKSRPLPVPPIWANYTAADYEDTDDLKFEHRDTFFDGFIDDMVRDGLRTKLVMFWHNHFVTELNVYDCNKYLWNYYYLLNQHCLGNFRTFVEAIGKSPAMLVYLNGNQNEVGKPNENYARELMELFTMGENNGYTQDDVVNVARALTGWRCNMYTCNDVTFSNNRFDNNNKTIFGQTGKWGYNDVHELIFTERKKQVAEFICGKLYSHFIHKNPDQEFVAELGQLFIDANWELLPVIKALFKSEHFFSDEFIDAIIKSPLECFIDLIRMTGVPPEKITSGFRTIRYGSSDLGMEIFNPINVAGWPGHQDWINENTLTQRWNITREIIAILSNADNREGLRNLAFSLVGDLSNDPDLITKELTFHFLGRELDENLHDAAVLYFKGDIPQNYFDDEIWDLYWNEAPFQIANLIGYLSRLPEFQLS
ncbi:MAG: DUF1800 domain-containing protein [Saprospiraceae bacterium]|nr:DUF1800 domain-containing protein [Saprospiraceae bacterium]